MRLQLTISGQKHWDHAASMQPLLLHLYPVRLPRALPSITRGSNPIPYLFPFFSPLSSLFFIPQIRCSTLPAANGSLPAIASGGTQGGGGPGAGAPPCHVRPRSTFVLLCRGCWCEELRRSYAGCVGVLLSF